MKKFAIVGIVTLVVLGIAWAQETDQPRRGAGRMGNMSEEQRQQFQQMRERFQNMSEEERAAFRERMRSQGGGFAGGFRGRNMSQEDQLAAIKAIEEQTAKLKASIENYERPDFSAMRDMSDEERTEFREKMMQTYNERREIITAIQEKINSLGMRRPEPTLTTEDIQEMGEIQKLAVQEKATKTAERLQALLGKFRRGMRGGPMGGTRGPRQPGEAGAPARRPRDRGAAPAEN